MGRCRKTRREESREYSGGCILILASGGARATDAHQSIPQTPHCRKRRQNLRQKSGNATLPRQIRKRQRFRYLLFRAHRLFTRIPRTVTVPNGIPVCRISIIGIMFFIAHTNPQVTAGQHLFRFQLYHFTSWYHIFLFHNLVFLLCFFTVVLRDISASPLFHDKLPAVADIDAGAKRFRYPTSAQVVDGTAIRMFRLHL